MQILRDLNTTTGTVRGGLPGRADGLPLTLTVGQASSALRQFGENAISVALIVHWCRARLKASARSTQPPNRETAAMLAIVMGSEPVPWISTSAAAIASEHRA